MSKTDSLHYQLCCLGGKFLKSRKSAEPWECANLLSILNLPPPHGILASYEAAKERLSAIEREIGSVEGKEMKAAIRSNREYSKAKAKLSRMSFLVN